MESNGIIQSVLTIIGSSLTTGISLLIPILKLNSTIATLNANFTTMKEEDNARNERITAHGKEIDKLAEKFRSHETALNIHEYRIQQLEEKK